MKNKIINFLGHPLLPEIAVIFSFLSFSLQPGALGDLMRVCGGIVLANLLVRNYRLNSPSAFPIYLIIGFLVVLAINFLSPHDKIHSRSFRYFLAFPGMALAIYYLILRKEEYKSQFSLELYAGIISAAIVTQLLVATLLDNRETLGVYSNLHRLGLFACLTFPVIVYMEIVSSKTWWRCLIFLVGLVDLFLLFSSNSRVSWVAFISGSVLTILIFFKGWKKIMAFVSLILFSFLAALAFGLSRLVDSAASFLTHVMEENRWTIWSDTINLLKDNSLLDWIIGHGIGSFRYYFKDYSTWPHYGNSPLPVFPHNGFLQVLFENGLVGFIIIFGALAFLMIAFLRAFRVFTAKHIHFFMVTIFAVFWIDFICFILDESVYSKYNLYSFSVIIGIMMALISKSRKIDTASSTAPHNVRSSNQAYS